MKTADGTVKELVPEINDVQRKILTTARDSTGSVYVLYYDGFASSLHLERFAADGTKDTSFGTAKSGFTLPDTSVTDIAVDFKTADVFLLKRTALPAGSQLTAYMAKKTDTGYTSFSTAQTVNLPSIPSGGANIDSVAAFDGTLFVAMDVQGSPNQKKLYAYKMETASIGAFSLSTSPAEVPFPELRAGASKKTRCTGLFADRQGVYALLTQQDPYPGIAPYAFGQMVRYSYNGTTLAEGAQKGLNPAASGTGPVKYESQYLSNPVGFIGYDGDTLYFADDGANIEYINENYRLNGDKDRIMAFNRKDNTVSDPSIGGDGAAWFENYNEYKKPNTKVLLWENTGGNIMKYWLGDNGSTPYPGDADALWASTSSSEAPTDVFCYDQDGNLYIVWQNNLGNRSIRCFYVQSDGTYDKSSAMNSNQNLSLQTTNDINAIAVDVSDGTHYLYCADKTANKIQRYSWSSSFHDAQLSTSYGINTTGKKITALAANRDGVFVGVQTVDTVPSRYMLSVKKYTKSDGASAGEITIGAPETIPTIPGSPYPDYTKSDHTITGLQVVDRVLYAITSKLEEKMVYNSDLNGYGIDEFKSSGILYKVAETAASFSGSAEMLDEKNPVSPPPGNNTGVGYGFYRFIAVKPKKLIIASNGACAVGGNASGSQTPPPDPRSDNKVVTYNLEGSLNPSEVDAGGKFYKKLTPGSGFAWE